MSISGDISLMVGSFNLFVFNIDKQQPPFDILSKLIKEKL